MLDNPAEVTNAAKEAYERGLITEAEMETFRLTAKKNAVNDGFERSEVTFLSDLSQLEACL